MSGHEPSPLIPIEKKKFLCIEYPGFVKRTDRAIRTLGGESILSEALSNDDQVQLRYRAKDIFSHPINGDFLDTCKLLAKVTRRVKKNKKTGEIVQDDSDAPWTIQILGTVEKTVRFRALADFQYIVPADDKIRQLKEALDMGDVERIVNYRVPDDDDDFDNLRNIPPPTFTPIEAPFNYGYKQNQPVLRVRVRQPDGSYKIKLLNRSRYYGHEVTAIKYDDENIPSKSWHNVKGPSTELEKEAIEAIADLFVDRPIWLRFAIRNNLDPKYHKYITKGLVHIAYTFQTGPWRECWVKYGINPKSNPKYYIYQQIDIRRIYKEGQTKRAIYRKTRASSTAKSEVPRQMPNQHVFDGKIVPGASCMYQICDLTDPDFTPITHNQDYIKQYSTKYGGFFYKCVFERLRKKLKLKYGELVDTGSAAPAQNIEEGLADDIAKEIASGRESTIDEEGDEEDDLNSSMITDFEKPAREAIHAMGHDEGSSKRLQQVADEYIEQLASVNKSMANDLEDDTNLDVIDAFEEFDDEDESDGINDEVADSQHQEQQKDIDENVKMRD
ncbi:RNA polymerase III transcription factor IIIC subunit-domain-containing protein [Parasitella parasitica]|nr:RNA polymerase III transcription factor IIIC subunit-domain-containing protein [Parasitella parasitica]